MKVCRREPGNGIVKSTRSTSLNYHVFITPRKVAKKLVLTRNLAAVRMLKLAVQSFRLLLGTDVNRMRSLREFSVLLLVCLAFGLVCGEIPEAFNLCDDTSNDFVGSSSGPRLGAVTIAHQVLASRQGSSVVDFAVRALAMISSAEPVIPSGPELLRLLSIQRK